MNSLKSIHVLLIEDSETQGLCIQYMLEEAQIKVTWCRSAELGIEVLRHTIPDLIILDYFLPGIKGDELCRRIRLDVNTSHVPIIMLSAQDTTGLAVKSDEMGADFYVPKPVDKELLLLRIKTLYLKQNRQKIEPTGGLRSARILAIDDSTTFIEHIKLCLSEDDYQVTVAYTGQEGLEKFRSGQFECVLTDLVLPDMTGVEVCKEINSLQENADNLAVLLVLTAHENKDQMIQCLQAGADDFIGKSSNTAVLKARIRSLLRKKFLQDENKRIMEQLKIRELETVKERSQKEVAQARGEMAQASTNAKSEFMANMSHEIRTPMNAIVGMVEILMDTPLNDEQKHYVQILKRSGENLLNLINGILEFSKLESGQIEILHENFDLREAMEGVVEMLAPKAHQKNLELLMEIPIGTPTTVNGDSYRLQQIFINLVGNSIKFTDTGHVKISLTQVEGHKYHFMVSDTGIGIHKDKLETIFQRFTQADSSITRKYGGTGLGLNISKQLVELMHGQISLQSEENKGTDFIFQLELAPPEEDLSQMALAVANSPALPSLFQGMRIYHCEPNPESLRINRDILKSFGLEVTSGQDSTKVIPELLLAQEKGSPYHFLLINAFLEKTSGLEVIQELKQLKISQPIPLLMISTDPSKGEMNQAKDKGIKYILLKPMRMSYLQEILKNAKKDLEQLDLPPAPSPTPPPHSSERPTILVVDDSDVNRFLILSYLKDQKVTVHEAVNGEDAVKKVQSQHFDLVLMDMQMPIMDGLTAVRILRAWEKEKGQLPLPILALTANALKEEELKTKEAGCTAHLTKPIKKQTLLENLNKHLHNLTSVG